MDKQEAYRIMAATCGINVGDRVRVIKRFHDNEAGCQIISFSGHDARVGCIGVVVEIDVDGRFLIEFEDDETDNFPFFVLEVVERISDRWAEAEMIYNQGMIILDSGPLDRPICQGQQNGLQFNEDEYRKNLEQDLRIGRKKRLAKVKAEINIVLQDASARPLAKCLTDLMEILEEVV